MKKRFAAITIMLFLETISWGQGTKDSLDTWKSRVELDIMQEILNTTLKSFAQNLQKESPRLQFSNLNSFYLAGQGAVFIIPTAGFRVFGFGSYPFIAEPELAELNRESIELSREAAALAARLYSGTGSGTGAAVAPVPPTPPEPPAPPAKDDKSQSSGKTSQPNSSRQQEQQELFRKHLDNAQERAKKIREGAEANRQKFLESLSELKSHLIEALATYGDSLSMVKPDEYVNLVLLTDTSDQRTRSDVISARKSWITDYKAGKLNLESFKQKVIQYTE